ncbi:hypothetical protein ABIE27_003881 [Paenibacillus sp. 4624]|jgi:hypothetical protein|uniref:Group-specific protein n=1 Tax=Paenibacillus amylolyticus TaxID=1451 RepID=A0A5M9WUX3_PAEAM|nr:hypothetical protein [Paenibacillus amylolyticus]KAA8785332.1 hypothetical protein EC604_15920 [Paenibacillus amylolyticus]
MKTEPVYAENTIVGVWFQGVWRWYVTEREYWFLNIEMEERFGIQVLNEETASAFLQAIQEEQVTAIELRSELHHFRETDPTGDEWFKYVPSFLVDFDKRLFFSMFPEPASFEHYMPDGWIGSYKDFLDMVPEKERYWMVQGKSLFEGNLF